MYKHKIDECVYHIHIKIQIFKLTIISKDTYYSVVSVKDYNGTAASLLSLHDVDGLKA